MSTSSIGKRVEHLPLELKREFRHIPLDRIEREVQAEVERLLAGAHFPDYVPLLARRMVREHLKVS